MQQNQSTEVERLQARLDELEERLKEGETNFFRAVKTFVLDFQEFVGGRTDKFPRAAALGLMFSYLRPRWVLAVGGVFAALAAVAQLIVILQQTSILRRQTELLSTQTEISEFAAVSNLVQALGSPDTLQRKLAVTQLGERGSVGFRILTRLAEEPDVELDAMNALFEQADWHSPSHVREVVALYHGKLLDFRYRTDDRSLRSWSFWQGSERSLARYLNILTNRAVAGDLANSKEQLAGALRSGNFNSVLKILATNAPLTDPFTTSGDTHPLWWAAASGLCSAIGVRGPLQPRDPYVTLWETVRRLEGTAAWRQTDNPINRLVLTDSVAVKQIDESVDLLCNLEENQGR